jgi:hypothetical protein
MLQKVDFRDGRRDGHTDERRETLDLAKEPIVENLRSPALSAARWSGGCAQAGARSPAFHRASHRDRTS